MEIKRFCFSLKGLLEVPIRWFGMVLLLVCMIPAELNAQTEKLSVDLDNVPLENVFKVIERQTPYRFFYSESYAELTKSVSVHVQNVNVEEVLQTVLGNTTLTYRITNSNLIVITQKTRQKESVRFVKGVVRDEFGETMIGVNIQVKGESRGVSTDLDGTFSIEVRNPETVLIFSYTGYEQQEIKVASKTELSVNMKPARELLDEVVVVGYSSQKKVNLTGAVQAVESDVLESRPIVNISQGLQGMVGNLNIENKGGRPGMGANLNIRGFTSINGGSPLVLVDGVEKDINLVNPQDVESVSVLKDAGSAAIYGARGAFGVILITTKSGKRGTKPTITYNGNMSFNTPTRIPDAVNSLEYVTYMNDAARNTGQDDYYTADYIAKIEAYMADPLNAPYAEVNKGKDEWEYFGNFSWKDLMLRSFAPQQNHNINIRGANEKLRYYLSGGYYDQEGMLKRGNDEYERYNFASNIDYDFTDFLTLSVKTSYSRTAEDHINDNYFGKSLDLGSADSGSALWYWLWRQMPMATEKSPDGEWMTGWSRPLSQVLEEGGRSQRVLNDYWMTFAAEARPVKGLRLKVDFSYNNKYDYRKRNLTPLTITKPSGATYVHFEPDMGSGPSYAYRSNTTNNYYSFNALAEYENTFADKHYFKGMVGFNQEYNKSEWLTGKRTDLLVNEIPNLNLATGDPVVSEGMWETALRGAFFRFNYIYDDRYLAEINGRYDGTSKYPKASRFGFFPSYSLGWRISEEAFFEPAKIVVDNLKLRASYGTLGNQAVGSAYGYIPTMGMNTDVGYYVGSGDGQIIQSVGAPGLVSATMTWEDITTLDIGLDFDCFRNRLSFTADWYRRDTRGMMVAQELPGVLGTGAPWKNQADLRTNGWEVSVGWRDQIRDFSYDVRLVLSDYLSTITNIPVESNYLYNYYPGMEVGEIWGLRSDGLIQQSDLVAYMLKDGIISNASEFYDAPSDVQAELNEEVVKPKYSMAKFYRNLGSNYNMGDVKYLRADGTDGTVDGDPINVGEETLENHGDLVKLGNNTPRFQFGLNLGFNWKGIDFTMFWQGAFKRDIMPNMCSNLFWGTYDRWDVPSKIHMDYWRPDNTDARWPRPTAIQGDGLQSNKNHHASQFAMQNAAYGRLKNLTVGYTFPQQWTRKIYVEKVRVYFSGANLWEITPLCETFDPEVVLGTTGFTAKTTGSQPILTSVDYQGRSGEHYPYYRSFSFGVDITF